MACFLIALFISVFALPAMADYTDQARTWTDKQMATAFSNAKIDALTAGTGPLTDSVIEMAATEARLWLIGGKTNTAYADSSLYAMKAIVAQWRRARDAGITQKIGFQAKAAFLDAYEILTTNGIGTTDTAFMADVKSIAAESMGPRSTIATTNADACNMAGTTRALKLWPDLDTHGKWTQYVKDVWGAWAACHDTTENSLNYNDLFLQMMIFTAQQSASVPTLSGENFLSQLQSSDSRAMFTRFRDQITGTGTEPIYGDNGSGRDLDNYNDWPNVFEWAGAQWKDGTFRWAAERKYEFARHGKVGTLALYLMTYADEWSDPAITPVAPVVGSALLMRVTQTNPKAPDQILLAPDRKARSPFFDATLFVGGGHPHDAQIGAVALYQVNGTVFLRGLGYDCSGSSESSLFLINKSSQPFPWRGMPQQDTWYDAQIPTTALVTVDDPSSPHAGKTVIDRPEWRWETRDKTGNSTAWISQLRLVAADGSETLLSALDDATGWPSGTTVAPGPQPGMKALQFVAGPNLRGNDATVYQVPPGQALGRYFDPAQYPFVRFYWKAHSAVPFDEQMCIYREYDGEAGQSVAPWDQIFHPSVTAEVESGGEGDYGAYTMQNYMGLGDTLQRRMVQLRDGAMVIMDTITASADHDGDAAGPIWQMLTASEPTPIGTHAYDASGFFNSITRTVGEDHLLVSMESAPDRTYGAQQTPLPLWGPQNPYAIYARSKLKKGEPVSYVTVLVPHGKAVDAAALDSGISIHRAGVDHATVTIKSDPALGAVEVELAANGAWKVIKAQP